jgi:hypothetical protein
MLLGARKSLVGGFLVFFEAKTLENPPSVYRAVKFFDFPRPQRGVLPKKG